MGERGPLPIAYARRRLHRRGAGPRGAQVTVGRPPMPRDLPADARDEWRRVVRALEEMGTLAALDRSLLLRYCLAWADWCELTRLLRTSGKLIRGQKGSLVRNPLWLMKRDAEQIVTDLARQLGLTPAARLRAGVRHERPADPGEQAGVLAIAEYRKMLGLAGC